ncbi:MAG: hypothetical protein IJE43_22250 [Alphaproteobacteria bacterium]|nr:hypothetical protein [Alphaproteobacteria bacterium]MBQ6887681.1 hypothetical protein [Lachnospiraceae bacterium]
MSLTLKTCPHCGAVIVKTKANPDCNCPYLLCKGTIFEPIFSNGKTPYNNTEEKPEHNFYIKQSELSKKYLYRHLDTYDKGSVDNLILIGILQNKYVHAISTLSPIHYVLTLEEIDKIIEIDELNKRNLD